MLEIITLLLPVIWAVIATVIGTVLYKTSQALFEQTNYSKAGRRTIRLVGSVTIAALAFGGMWYATPSSRLGGLPQGAVIIESNDAKRMFELTTDLDRSTLELQACANTLNLSQCVEQINSIRNQAVSINETF